MNLKSSSVPHILLSLIAFLVPVGHLIFDGSQNFVFYFQRGICCVFMFVFFMRPFKKTHLRGSYQKFALLYFIFLISLIPAALRTSAGFGVPFNFLIPVVFATMLVLGCKSNVFIMMFKAFWWSVFCSAWVVVVYRLGFIPRPSGNVIGYEISAYSRTFIDQFYMIGMQPSIESASVYRAVAIMLGILLYTLCRKKIYLIGTLIIGAHQLWAIFYTGNGRSGGVFLAVSLLCYFFFQKKNKKVQISSGLLIIVLGAILSSSAYFDFSKLVRKELPVGASIGERAVLLSSGRGYKWFVALDMIKNNPLQGVGLYNFVEQASLYNVPNWVRPFGDVKRIESGSNLVFLDTAAEAGILSGILLLLFVVRFNLYLYKLSEDSRWAIVKNQYHVLSAIMIGSFFGSFFEGSMQGKFTHVFS